MTDAPHHAGVMAAPATPRTLLVTVPVAGIAIPHTKAERQATILNEHDRDLLMLLGAVGKQISGIVTGLFDDTLSLDEQTLFANQLVQVADRFRHRAHHTPIVIDADPVAAHEK